MIENLSSILISELCAKTDLRDSDYFIISRLEDTTMDSQYVSYKTHVSAYTEKIVGKDVVLTSTLSVLSTELNEEIADLKETALKIYGDQTITGEKTFVENLYLGSDLIFKLSDDIRANIPDSNQERNLQFVDKNGNLEAELLMCHKAETGNFSYQLILYGKNNELAAYVELSSNRSDLTQLTFKADNINIQSANGVTINGSKVVTLSVLEQYIPISPTGNKYESEKWLFKVSNGNTVDRYVVVAKP